MKRFKLTTILLLIFVSCGFGQNFHLTEVNYYGGTLRDEDRNELAKIEEGELIKVFEEFDKPYFKVEYNGITGYLSYGSIKLTKELEYIAHRDKYFVETEINYKGAELKSQPKYGKEFVIDELEPGEKVFVHLKEFKSPFFKITTNSKEGYVSQGSLVKNDRIKKAASGYSTSKSTSTNSSGSTSTKDFFKWMAKEKWPNDFTMQEYLIKKQTESFAKLSSLIKTNGGINKANFQTILGNALSKWVIEDCPAKFDKIGYDYSMVVYEVKRQVESYKRLND